VPMKQSYRFLVATTQSSGACNSGITVQPGPPMMLWRRTFLRVAAGSSARVRQNGLARISASSR